MLAACRHGWGGVDTATAASRFLWPKRATRTPANTTAASRRSPPPAPSPAHCIGSAVWLHLHHHRVLTPNDARWVEAAQSGAIADRHFFSPDFLTTNFTDGAGRHSRKLLGSGDGPRDDARARRIIQHAARRVAGLGWIGGCTVRLVLSPRTTPRRRPASSWWHGAPLANGGVAGAPPRRRTAAADLHCAVKSRRGAIASVWPCGGLGSELLQSTRRAFPQHLVWCTRGYSCDARVVHLPISGGSAACGRG